MNLRLTKSKKEINIKYNQPFSILKFFNLDLSLFLLIISNIITIIFAISEKWSLITIMWIYWSQSIIIGVFNFIRILTLKDFTTDNFKINGIQPNNSSSTKYFTAFFFLIHYGFFHIGYMIFLSIESFNKISRFNSPDIGISFLFILLSIVIFFANHLYSFIANYEKDSNKVKNIGTIMFFPYARIIPMHLTIVFGLFLVNSITGLIFFMILKTIADIVMHQVEHHI